MNANQGASSDVDRHAVCGRGVSIFPLSVAAYLPFQSSTLPALFLPPAMNVGSSSSQNVLESETGELIHPPSHHRSSNDCLGGLDWDALRSGFEKGTFKTEDQLTRRLQALGSRFIVVGQDLHAVTHLDMIDLSHEGLVPGGWTSLPAVSAVRDWFEEIRERKRKVRSIRWNRG